MIILRGCQLFFKHLITPAKLPEKTSMLISLCTLQVIAMDTDDEQVLSLLVESFLLSGRVTNITSLVAFHPQYLEFFLRTEYFMFKGEGPLPFDWRCYIAIMVRE